MKTDLSFSCVVAVALVGVLAVGCDSKQATAPTPDSKPAEMAQPAAAPAPAAVQPAAAEAAKPTAPAVAQSLANSGATVGDLVKSQAQALLDQAQKLAGNNQFADAGKVLQQLTGMTLTPEQQRIVSQLQPLVEKALASEAVRGQAQALIEQAQKLVSGSKFEEASKILKQIASYNLSPDQQKIVSDLKAVVEKAVAAKVTAEGVKAVGDLFKKK